MRSVWASFELLWVKRTCDMPVTWCTSSLQICFTDSVLNTMSHFCLQLAWCGSWLRIHSRSSACQRYSASLQRSSRKTAEADWWASQEKCPWSHMNQSFLQAGFPLIRGSALRRIVIVFPSSANHDAPDVYTGKVGGISAQSGSTLHLRYNHVKSDSDSRFVFPSNRTSGFHVVTVKSYLWQMSQCM